jgi:hypothetical protein
LEALAGIAATPVLVRTRSWEGGFHQYTLGHLERVARAEAALGSQPGLLLAGAAFHGIGLNECVASGRRAADAALAAVGSPPDPLLPTRHVDNRPFHARNGRVGESHPRNGVIQGGDGRVGTTG